MRPSEIASPPDGSRLGAPHTRHRESAQTPGPALLAVGARARHLKERLSAGGLENSTQVATPSRFDAFERWRFSFSRDDTEAFRRRLSWDGLDEAAVRRALAAPARSDRAEPPAWLVRLAQTAGGGAEISRAIADAEQLAEVSLFTHDDTPAFFELWVPFVRWARHRLTEAVESLPSLTTPKALAGLERSLLRELAATGAIAAYETFDLKREADSGAARKRSLPIAASRVRRAFYDPFVRSLLADRFEGFFAEFSTLARQLQRLTDCWVESTSELLWRLAADRDQLRELFVPGRSELGAITQIEPGLSDPHQGRRQVLALTFNCGLKVIYKPRPAGLEAAYNRFLTWVGPRLQATAPSPLRVLARENYGWFEHVESSPASTTDEARSYFEKAGGLLCLTYLLNGTDLHMDNVIATARGPVIVDAETLLQPAMASDSLADRSALGRARQRVRDSFMGTGLLSFPRADPNGLLYEIGGLLGRGGHLITERKRVWRRRNTDAMRPEREAAFGPPMGNVLWLDGKPQDPKIYAGSIAEGFAKLYRALLSARDEILLPDGPLSWFAGQRSRVVFRSSNLYAIALQKLRTPAYQRDGLAGACLIESINRTFGKEHRRPALWPLVADERASLEGLDIPYFTIDTGSTSPGSASGEPIEGVFARSGLDIVAERLRGFGQEDLRHQLEILLAALDDEARPASRPIVSAGESVATEADSAVDDGQFLQAARVIADRLHRRAILGEDGSATWIAPAHLQGAGRSDRGVAYHLYDGAAGVALFLAASYRLTGATADADLARAACRPISRVLDDPDAELLLRREKLGACTGLGSLIYGLTVIGHLLQASQPVELALRIARYVSPERIAADRDLDVESGAAGAIFALLALYREIGEKWLLGRALACGRHLLDHAQSGDGGHGLGWPNAESLRLAGFAHGAAGIGAALQRLFEASGERRFLTAAREARAYERSLFSPDAGNWPILQGSGAPVFMTSWCHGAPGIGLARAMALEPLDNGEIAADLEVALSTTLEAPLAPADHLCCGNLGRAEILLTIGLLLDRQDLLASARALAARILQRATADSDSTSGVFRPGFFRGLAGIGYSYLRQTRPSHLPSVLRFQAGPAGPLAPAEIPT